MDHKVIHAKANHTQVSVSVAEHRGNWALFFFLIVVSELPSGRQLAVAASASGHSAVTKGFQLCSAGPLRGAPVCPCTQRSHCYSPADSYEPAVTAPRYTLVGNFKQTSSKAAWFTPRNTQESVNVPLCDCALCHTLAPATRCQLYNWWLFSVFVWTWVTYSEAHTQTSTHVWLINDPWCRGGYVLAEIITVYSFTVLCFTAALFEECLVTRHACAGHIRREFTLSAWDACQ